MFVVDKDRCEHGFCVRHESRDLFRFAALFGTIPDDAVDVGGTVGVRHWLLGQTGFDDKQRVPVLGGPRNPVGRAVCTPESAGGVHHDHLERFEAKGEEPEGRVGRGVCVDPKACFADLDRVDGSVGQVVGLVVVPPGP